MGGFFCWWRQQVRSRAAFLHLGGGNGSKCAPEMQIYTGGGETAVSALLRCKLALGAGRTAECSLLRCNFALGAEDRRKVQGAGTAAGMVRDERLNAKKHLRRPRLRRARRISAKMQLFRFFSRGESEITAFLHLLRRIHYMPAGITVFLHLLGRVLRRASVRGLLAYTCSAPASNAAGSTLRTRSIVPPPRHTSPS